MLIERCVPGDDASTIGDEDAIRVALATGRMLWRPVTGGPFRRGGDEAVRVDDGEWLALDPGEVPATVRQVSVVRWLLAERPTAP